ncbi:chromosome segregation protein Spc25-domain-containing protein [Phascolomyces articulosus]|uniref:Kinetochore protein SPC25 n=1 Tax=Phascolomyces articulosus TaxID=60185 RepID=A0AAD5K3A6_9FUNG|nr:chromosome segregation protein Spc25-domain-containing protein [Phascolomyces articulosus]
MNDPSEIPKFESQENEYESRFARIQSIVQQHSTLVHEKKAAVQRDVEASIRQSTDNQRALREEIIKYENYVQQHQQKLPDTQERTKQLAEELEGYRSQYEAKLTKLKNIQQARDRLKATIERRKADKEAQTSKARKQLDKAELLANREALQLKITGLGDFKNKFEFKCINENHPDQIFSFVLRVSADGTYSVSECNPLIDNLDEMVNKLRQENDPYLFIKRMRNAFCEYVVNSNSNSNNSNNSNNSSKGDGSG